MLCMYIIIIALLFLNPTKQYNTICKIYYISKTNNQMESYSISYLFIQNPFHKSNILSMYEQ